MKQRFGKMLGSSRSGSRSRLERKRKLGLESLEGRRLLAVDLSLVHHNHIIAEDANGDFNVSPLDALIVINEINRGGTRDLSGTEGEAPDSGNKPMKFDVSGDNFLSPLDVLLVINRLNAEGEGDDLMGFTYQVTDLSGTPIPPNSITVGQDFRVNVLVQDLRPTADATGVFSAKVDLGVTNLDLVSFQPSTSAPYRVAIGPLFGAVVTPAGGEGGGLQIGGGSGNAAVRDGETFSLNSLVFEFDTNDVFTAGNIPVDLPNATGNSFNTVSNALIAAINGSSLGPVAKANGLGVVGLPDRLQDTFVPPAVVAPAVVPSLTWSDVEVEYFNDIHAVVNQLSGGTGPIGPVLLYSANFRATQPGTVTFNPNHAESPINENLLFGGEENIPNDLISVGNPFSVTIITDPTGPVAVNDTLSSPEDTQLTFVASTLLANDTVTAPRTLTLVSVNSIPGVTRGTLNGLNYTPESNYFGQDRVTYTIEDSTGLRSTGTVTLNISPVNDAPVAAPDMFSVVEDSVNEPLTGLLNNDNGGPGETNDVLRIRSVGATNNGGTVTVTSNGLGLLYTPAPGFVGTEMFTYTIEDQGGLTATANVTIEVEPLVVPRARLDTETVSEDTTNNAIDVLANDRVNEGEQAVLISVTQPANGTVTINDNGTPNDRTDDTVFYTPDDDFFGTDTFTYVMNDTLDPPGENSTGTVTVTVTDVNDPVELTNDTATATEDQVATFTAASLLANDSPGAGEAGRQTLTITGVAAVGAGGTVARSGTNIVYTPTPNFNGSFVFTYTATDNGTPASSGTATVTVTVAAVNDNPVAGGDTLATNEDTAVSVGVATLLANDLAGPQDEATQTLSITAVSPTSTNNGTVGLNAGNVTYTPAANFNGTDTFTYTLSDGAGGTATGTVTVTVNAINDAPILGVDSVVAFADFPATILANTLLANDRPGPANESAQTLRITAVTATANTNGTVLLNADGTITYTPAAGYTGPASFQYRVEDNGPSSGNNVNFALGTVNVTVQEFVPSSISGTVWVDETRDGNIDAAERRLGGVEVTLTGMALGEAIAPVTLITLADGSYQFDTLAPGQYTVSYSTPMFMMDNVNMADTYTINIVEPGGVNSTNNNFASIGLNSTHVRAIDQLASRYYIQNPALVYTGAYFALAADGSMLWGANLDGFDAVDFAEAVIDGNELLLTTVDGSRSVETARLARGQFLTTHDSAGNTLVRVLGGYDHFSNWQSVNLSAPPVVSSARYLEAIDEIFEQEEW